METPDDWLALWRDCGAGNNGERAFSELIKAYSFPAERFYHTLKHVRECLDEFAAAKSLTAHPREIDFALWYHDAIYNSRAKDNEERSADLAKRTAIENGFDPKFAQRVYDLILATRHKTEPAGDDEKIIVDVDLSILGKPDPVFDQYEIDIRKEYAWVDEAQFRAGRGAILKAFLERPRIYSTPFFYSKYEAKARRNLARSIAQLA